MGTVRGLILLLAWTVAAFGPACCRADIEYHFVPGMDGQPSGNAQFAQVAPVYGPQDFTVQLSGALVGDLPSQDNGTAVAYLDKWGLGVLNPLASKDTGVQGQVQLDGSNGGEYLRLEFEVPVQLTYVTFASVGLADKFGLVADGTEVDLSALFPGHETIRSVSLAQGNWPGAIDFTQAAETLGFAKVWDFFTLNPNFGDGIQLENLGVRPVPEPATLSLWCAACAAGGIVLFRRRRNRAHRRT